MSAHLVLTAAQDSCCYCHCRDEEGELEECKGPTAGKDGDQDVALKSTFFQPTKPLPGIQVSKRRSPPRMKRVGSTFR